MKQFIGQFLSNAAIVLKVLAIVAIPTTLLIFHVWTQYRITEVGYEIAEVTTEHRLLIEENKKLTIEARMQGRSDRIAELAQDRFGLQKAHPDQVIMVDLGTPVPVEVQKQEHARLDGAEGSSVQASVQ